MAAITDEKYLNLIDAAINQGEYVEDGHKKMFSIQNQMVVFEQTPLVTIRKTAWKTALREMEWFLSGSTNINDAHPSVRPWWEPWADNSGKIHLSYGHQFKSFLGSFNQIQHLIDSLKDRPKGRSNLITTWNTVDMKYAPIHNCHGTVIKFRVGKKGLELTMVQRSADLILGVPHNWIQYSLFGSWLSHLVFEEPLEKFTWIGLDCHVYEQHLSLAHRMLRYWETIDKEKAKNTRGPRIILVGEIDTEFKAENFFMPGDQPGPIFTDKPKLIV